MISADLGGVRPRFTKRERIFASVAVLVGLLFALIVGELCLRIFSPVPSMAPRYAFSREYGLAMPASTEVVHSKPGYWRFTYQVNEWGHRGAMPDQSDSAREDVVVVLGDSYTFGIGVSDGDEYPAVIAQELESTYAVVNLGSGGWGLTQEIRRYYEFGRGYEPSVVILQFCSNDVPDGVKYPVARSTDLGFEFSQSENRYSSLKSWIGASVVQRSQLYNRLRLFGRRAASTGEAGGAEQDAQEMYIGLLQAFSAELAREGRVFFVIAVNEQVDEFPEIRAALSALEMKGELRYIETLDWFDGKPIPSPEGHAWGKAAHQIVGKHLAVLIQELQGIVPQPNPFGRGMNLSVGVL